MNETTALRMQLTRQVAHWQSALLTLDDANNFAAISSWDTIERYLNTEIREQLHAAVKRLQIEAQGLERQLAHATTLAQLRLVGARLRRFRHRFVQAETVLDFYGDAINTRTSDKLGSILRALDLIAYRSMDVVLSPLGRVTPPVLTYIDKGLGASILRAGVRLWDQNTISPAAAIKITRHNLLRPTSLIHETGHQVASILSWTDEFSDALRQELAPIAPRQVVDGWADTASEVVADIFAFVHCGYGAVAALHDVVAAEHLAVLRYLPGDPHPIPFIRVLLNIELCRRMFGAGPWDDMAAAWRQIYPLEHAMPGTRKFLELSMGILPLLAEISLNRRMTAFGGRSIVDLVDPLRVKPEALVKWSTEIGSGLTTSPYWATEEPLRLLALTSYRFAVEPQRSEEIAQHYETWTRRLGSAVAA